MTEEQKAKYLDALRGHGYMTHAAQEAGVTTSAIRGERRRNPMFDKAAGYYFLGAVFFCGLTAGANAGDVQDIKGLYGKARSRSWRETCLAVRE